MLFRRCPLLETKCGWNAKSTLLSGLTRGGLARTKLMLKVRGPIWTLILHCKILLGEQIQSCFKKFIFHESTYKSPSYASTPCSYLSFQFDWQPLYFYIAFFSWSVFSRIRGEYGEIQSIYSKYGKIRTRKTPNRNIFHAASTFF